MNQIELRASFSLAFIYILRMLGLFMVMPVLAVSAVEFPDYSSLMLGIAVGGYGLSQAMLQIPMGVLSDRWGRKPIIIIGLLLFALGSGVAAIADSMAVLVLGRFLQGAGAIAGAIMALATDVSREQQRAKVMAIIGIAIGFSFYLALLLGPVLATQIGLSGIFALTGLLALACIPLLIFVVPGSQPEQASGDTLPTLSDVRRMIFHPQLSVLNISVLLLHMLITLLFVQVPSILVQLQWPLDVHWMFYLPVLFIAIVGMLALMRVAKHKGLNFSLKLSTALLALVFLGLIVGQANILLLGVLACVFFASFNFLEANFPALVASIAPAGKKGSAMGIYASFQFFGAFLGGLLSGWLSQYLGATGVFIVAALLCAMWTYFIPAFIRNNSVKRYTLRAHLESQSLPAIEQGLRQLEGVKDIRLEAEQGTVYLKVDQNTFQLQQAKALLNIE